MKLLTKPVIFISALFILIEVAGCKKDSDTVITIEGFKLADASGNDFGRYGPEDTDWTFDNTLSDRELALFDFTTTYTLDNTKEATIASYIGRNLQAYPNPCMQIQAYHINASDSVLLKVVVVNKKLEVLTKTALKLKGSKTFSISYDDPAIYPDKSVMRMYFSISALNKPNYKVGYGDIRICRATSNLDECFK